MCSLSSHILLPMSMGAMGAAGLSGFFFISVVFEEINLYSNISFVLKYDMKAALYAYV